MFYWDPTYILVLIGMVICMGASALVNSAMNKYSRVRNGSGITGEEAARRILNSEGLYNVQIECLSSDRGDHYDPRTNTVRLSRSNFTQPSVTAVGVAAHEAGHAPATCALGLCYEMGTGVVQDRARALGLQPGWFG